MSKGKRYNYRKVTAISFLFSLLFVSCSNDLCPKGMTSEEKARFKREQAVYGSMEKKSIPSPKKKKPENTRVADLYSFTHIDGKTLIYHCRK